MKRYAISLFSGAGGFDLGMEAAGFTTRYCSDIDFHSCQTLQNNRDEGLRSGLHHFLSEATVEQADIKEVTTEHILDRANLKKDEVSLIYGGPPCQAFSVFGQRKGMDDPRGLLLWEYIRVIREISPPIFVFENVAGLLSIDNGKVFNMFLDEVSKDSNGNKVYEISHYLLDTAEYGVPQFRSRLIVFGAKGKEIPPIPVTHTEHPAEATLRAYNTVGKVLNDMPTPPSSKLANHIGRVHGTDIINRYSALAYGERDSKTRINRLNPNRPSYTIVVGSDKGGGKGHVHPEEPREVTPRESARIQTFPDFWAFSGTSRHPIRQVGNAVPPVFGAVIGSHILKEFFEDPDAPNFDQIIKNLKLEYLY
ncbi:DNA cytosine methyltransferase [Faecalispora jeddahensis]|uniref:DNA cytosine methyltransferase n=1 Tax=Faecalispora jeddahensis TaxID=1414721 RepID=UPI00145B0F40|nr:DNA cytosine methyltransferase [Faecalispora jeddahensis]